MEKSPVTWIGMIWFPMYLTVFVPPPFNVPVAMNIRGIRSDRITITVYNPVFAAVDKADRVYGMDPKVARTKEELLIRQGELSREIALANKEIKKKGGEKLKELDEQISELEKIAGKAERVPEHGYHSQIAKTANSQKWVQVDLGKREKITSVSLHACSDDFAGLGQVLVFLFDSKSLHPIRRTFRGRKSWSIKQKRNSLIQN
jgi:hypothetical protein